MPKPPNRPAPQPTTFTPNQHLPNFTLGYWCPECLTPLPPNHGVQRPPIWHDECKPPTRDPRRRKRICPGCGLMHELSFATSSAYDKPACKSMYMAKIGVNKRPPKPCLVCGGPNNGNKLSIRLGLCALHFKQVIWLTSLRSDRNEPLFGNYEALTAIQEPETYLTEAQRNHLATLNPATPNAPSPTRSLVPVDDDEVDWS